MKCFFGFILCVLFASNAHCIYHPPTEERQRQREAMANLFGESREFDRFYQDIIWSEKNISADERAWLTERVQIVLKDLKQGIMNAYQENDVEITNGLLVYNGENEEVMETVKMMNVRFIRTPEQIIAEQQANKHNFDNLIMQMKEFECDDILLEKDREHSDFPIWPGGCNYCKKEYENITKKPDWMSFNLNNRTEIDHFVSLCIIHDYYDRFPTVPKNFDLL